MAASTPYGEHSVVVGSYPGDGVAYTHHLAEHFVPNDEFPHTIRSLRTTSGYFFPVDTAYPNRYDPKFDIVRCRDGGFWPFNYSCAGDTWNDCDCFHERMLPSITFFLAISTLPESVRLSTRCNRFANV